MALVQFVFKFTCPASRLIAERSRVNSSTAAVMASGGSAGFDRSNAARNRDTSTTSPFVSRSNVPVAPKVSSNARRWLSGVRPVPS